jgi:hypothetical protein
MLAVSDAGLFNDFATKEAIAAALVVEALAAERRSRSLEPELTLVA